VTDVPQGQSSAPLAGVTVVALEQALSAPICTRTLADLGARVIKIENPRGGDFARAYDDVVHGLAAHFVWANRNKESVALDVKHPEGRDILDRLLANADVLVSNLAPGAMARMGFGRVEVRELHPHLIALEIDGYGSGGPLSHKRAYDILAQAESGACAATGWAGSPAKPGPPVADVCSGLYGAISILGALHRGFANPRGADIGVSLFDTMAELMSYQLHYTRYTGIEQEPVGMGSPAVAPYGAFRTADGHTVVLGTTNDVEWQRLSRTLIGRPDLADDPRYASNSDRVAQRAELDAAIGAWCGTKDLADIQIEADEAGIGNSRLNGIADVVAHPHLAARERWQDIETPGGTVPALLPLADLRGLPSGDGRGACSRRAHRRRAR
jgi:crotonobetainyl-CoA:carnitine CoA-transferase CaiB-like acyl-CoA transferase